MEADWKNWDPERFVALLGAVAGKEKVNKALHFLRTNLTPKKTPSGMLGKWVIIGGKPHGRFTVPWKSKTWMDKIERSQRGELKHDYTHMKGFSDKQLLVLTQTKEEVREMTMKFDSDGCFYTEDIELAHIARQAARSMRGMAGMSRYVQEFDFLDRNSKPLPDDPRYPVLHWPDPYSPASRPGPGEAA